MNTLPTFPPRACTFALEPRILFWCRNGCGGYPLLPSNTIYSRDDQSPGKAVTNRPRCRLNRMPTDAGAAASATLLIVDGRVRDTATLLDDMPANVTIVVEVCESGLPQRWLRWIALKQLIDSDQQSRYGGGFFGQRLH